MNDLNSSDGHDKAHSVNTYDPIDDDISNCAFDNEDIAAGMGRPTVDHTERQNRKGETLSKETLKDGVSSNDATSSKRLFGNPADTHSDRVKSLKIYSSDGVEKNSENYFEIDDRLKAYVGSIEEAEEHCVDN